MAGFNDEFMDRPASVIHQETTYVTNCFAAGLDVVAGYGLSALEVLVVRVMVEMGLHLIF